MGTASAVFYTRQATTMTPAHFADNGNVIFDTIESAGMVQVAHEVIPGQCDKLVTAATENAYDVVVSLAYPGWVGVNNSASKGMKVFQHPHLSFYLKVEIHETGAGGANSIAMTVRYIVASEIDVDGNLIKPTTFSPRGGANAGWSVAFNALNNTGQGYASGLALQLKVSVGVDHFCLGHTKDLQTYDAGYLWQNNTNAANCGPCLLGYSTCSIAILKSQDSADLFVLLPRNLNNGSSYPNEISATSYIEVESGLPRQYRIDASTGNSVSLGNSFFSALQTGVVSDSTGVRVAQVMTTYNDQLIALPLVTMHSGAIQDNAVINVDVDGNGERQYFAVYGFGASAWHPSRFPVDKHPIYLLPWGD